MESKQNCLGESECPTVRANVTLAGTALLDLALFLAFSLNPALRSLPRCCPSVSWLAAVYQWHPSSGVLQVDFAFPRAGHPQPPCFPHSSPRCSPGWECLQSYKSRGRVWVPRVLSEQPFCLHQAALQHCCSRAVSHCLHSYTWYHPACYLAQ